MCLKNGIINHYMDKIKNLLYASDQGTIVYKKKAIPKKIENNDKA